MPAAKLPASGRSDLSTCKVALAHPTASPGGGWQEVAWPARRGAPRRNSGAVLTSGKTFPEISFAGPNSSSFRAVSTTEERLGFWA